VVTILGELCALPDAELRARAAAAHETLYGESFTPARPSVSR
jgi:hypothetical protein